ncbi:EF-hand domain-containing protein [Marinobacter panjinensis]|uniref:EF-hand domain-containing protein n=1 Tax=Marinobacter panjinensis TaxID=2576384 RepID=A0A4V6CV92_9GAMM|nr:hypothetical protein [Marinobacter panjinensis]TKV66965.1 EF-hand domain-containing protein [Marinobacter panjinensis]
MKTKPSILLGLALGIGVTGCSAMKSSEPSDTVTKTSDSPMAQFKCADRNGNEYIDQSELVNLRQCGIGEDLACGSVPESSKERPAKTDFDLGLRFLQITDADGDDRISKLEFRAHCNDDEFRTSY